MFMRLDLKLAIKRSDHGPKQIPPMIVLIKSHEITLVTEVEAGAGGGSKNNKSR